MAKQRKSRGEISGRRPRRVPFFLRRALGSASDRLLDVLGEDARRREAGEPLTSKTILRLVAAAAGLSGTAFLIYQLFIAD